MRSMLRPALVLLLLLTMLTGLVYPLTVTALAKWLFPYQANGSLVVQDGQIVGSALIGQPFDAPQYFWGRPSATLPSPYNPFDAETLTGSAGSNLGPLSKELMERVQARVRALAADPGNRAAIPADLVTASASGLDPDISVAAALYQVPRVARARGMDEATLREFVLRHTSGRQFGVLGEPRVNVLKLNLALDMVE